MWSRWKCFTVSCSPELMSLSGQVSEDLEVVTTWRKEDTEEEEEFCVRVQRGEGRGRKGRGEGKGGRREEGEGRRKGEGGGRGERVHLRNYVQGQQESDL